MNTGNCTALNEATGSVEWQHAKEAKRLDERARLFEAKRSVQSGVALSFPLHSKSQA